MGLFRFIADMETYSKISDKYGHGAAWKYLEDRIEDDYNRQTSNINKNTSNYKAALEKVKNDLRFYFTNHIRQNDKLYDEDDRKYLDGIIKQIDLVSNQENVNELINEFNDFSFSKEYPYEISLCIKENKVQIAELLKKYNKYMTLEEMEYISNELDNLANIQNYKELSDKYLAFMKKAKKHIRKYNIIFSEIINKDFDIKSKYGKLSNR